LIDVAYPAARIQFIGHDRTPIDNPRWVIVNYDLLKNEANPPGRMWATGSGLAVTAAYRSSAAFLRLVT
jgi:hypothetical protein